MSVRLVLFGGAILVGVVVAVGTLIATYVNGPQTEKPHTVNNSHSFQYESRPPSPIRRRREKRNETEECLICVESMENLSACKTTPCGHTYHTLCLNKWLLVSRSCPVCRKRL